jgi:signal transduction histidine kinase
VPQEFSVQITPPFLSHGSDRDLGLDSTLQELSMYSFQIEASCTAMAITQFFEKFPLLPGAILLEQGKFVGMISRQRLLEFLIRPYGQELFFQQPLSVLYSYARTEILQFPGTTSVLTAMQLAMRRSAELVGEPVVVQTARDVYQLLDIHELHLAAWQIRGIETQVRYERSQVKMIQHDKMASLGRLVDGVAHEILDPVSFIWGNLTYVSNYSQDLLKLVTAYDSNLPETPEEIIHLKDEIEFDYLEQDLSKALTSIRTGAERLKKLVTSLQNFCYIDEIYPRPADLHSCLDSIVLLINSRIKGEIEIVKHYGHLPPVNCFLGQLSQVFMNIFSESIDTLLNEAIRQQFHPDSTIINHKPRIDITTKVISQITDHSVVSDSRWVSIQIADNGPGLPEHLQQQVIDSFTVEKRADKVTSLSLSYRIITSRHGGKFNYRSQLGIGSEFEILLPLA